MADYLVVVADAAEARFLTLEPVEFPELESGPRLIERGILSDSEKRLPERERYSDSKTGRGRAPKGGPAHGYDDHRDQRESEDEQRFVRQILEKAVEMAKAHRVRRVILAAPAKMRGAFRQDLPRFTKGGFQVQDIPKDMTKFTPDEIHEHLANDRLLPARRRQAS